MKVSTQGSITKSEIETLIREDLKRKGVEIRSISWNVSQGYTEVGHGTIDTIPPSVECSFAILTHNRFQS